MSIFFQVKLQGQGHMVKNNSMYGKVLSPGILMWNIKALELTVQKLLARLKFSNSWVKLQGQGHKVKNIWDSCEILKLDITLSSNVISNVKFLNNGSNSKVKVTR